MSVLLVITSAGTEEQANLLADELVIRRHATCANIVRIHRSVYRWKGRIFDDHEYFVILKTSEEEYPTVENAINELSNYEVPETFAVKASHGEAGFVEWILAGLDKSVDSEDSIEPR